MRHNGATRKSPPSDFEMRKSYIFSRFSSQQCLKRSCNQNTKNVVRSQTIKSQLKFVDTWSWRNFWKSPKIWKNKCSSEHYMITKQAKFKSTWQTDPKGRGQRVMKTFSAVAPIGGPSRVRAARTGSPLFEGNSSAVMHSHANKLEQSTQAVSGSRAFARTAIATETALNCHGNRL